MLLVFYFDARPGIICPIASGGIIFDKILPAVFLSLLAGGILLPLLIDFGLPEFFGVLMGGIMRPVFRLPAHSSVACITLWFGDSCVGILIANQQYERGKYTIREAAVIGTTFSTVSITFSLVVISQVGLANQFIPFYFTVCTTGIINAIIVPRIPPLSSKPDMYIGREGKQPLEPMPENGNIWSYAISQATSKTCTLKCLSRIFKDNIIDVLDMVITLLPIATIVITITFFLSEHTSIFQFFGKPFVPILSLLQIPEAANASECILIGFADMILPSVVANSIQSELTRFFVVTMSVVQLVYLSETGALIIASKISVNIFELFIIFILRTIISLPIVAFMSHLFY